jgi:hypothetical protein
VGKKVIASRHDCPSNNGIMLNTNDGIDTSPIAFAVAYFRDWNKEMFKWKQYK